MCCPPKSAHHLFFWLTNGSRFWNRKINPHDALKSIWSFGYNALWKSLAFLWQWHPWQLKFLSSCCCKIQQCSTLSSIGIFTKFHCFQNIQTVQHSILNEILCGCFQLFVFDSWSWIWFELEILNFFSMSSYLTPLSSFSMIANFICVACCFLASSDASWNWVFACFADIAVCCAVLTFFLLVLMMYLSNLFSSFFLPRSLATEKKWLFFSTPMQFFHEHQHNSLVSTCLYP